MNSPTAIETYTGLFFDAFDIRPEDMCIEDVAHHLSLESRFSGACQRFYSVAEHSLNVAAFVDMELDGSFQERLAALLHDCSETWLKDLPSPLKSQREFGRRYRDLEEDIMLAAHHLFAFDYPLPPKVHTADEALQWLEADALMHTGGREWTGFDEHGSLILKAFGARWKPRVSRDIAATALVVENVFLDEYASLRAAIEKGTAA